MIYPERTRLTYAQFQTAALTNTIALPDLAARGRIHCVTVEPIVAFAGTSISSLSLTIGPLGELDKYLPGTGGAAFSLLQAPGAAVGMLRSGPWIESFGAVTAIKATLTAVGANLSALTAGAIDVWIDKDALPPQ